MFSAINVLYKINFFFQNYYTAFKIPTKLPTELPTPWNFKIPKKYKRNVIIGDLHASKQISTDFTKEKISKTNLKKWIF